MWLNGGGCTGNRVAYNQTAANALLAKGYSQYAMIMQQQALPANTKVTKIAESGLMYATAATTQEPPSLVTPILLSAVGVGVAVVGVVMYKRVSH